MCAVHLVVVSMSERVTVQGEIGRSATTSLLDEGIDQYHGMDWTYPQRALRSLRIADERIGIISFQARDTLTNIAP